MTRAAPFALLALLLCLPVLAPVPVRADDDRDQDRAHRALEAGEILPLTEILKQAEAARPGRVIEVDLERDDGRWVYELDVITPEGALYEIEIDAATGAVLDLEREDD